MANLTKMGAKAPRVSKGYSFVGCNYANDEPRAPNGMPPMLYNVTVGQKGVPKPSQYTAELTEAEMLDTVAEWMKLYARNRAEERKRCLLKTSRSS